LKRIFTFGASLALALAFVPRARASQVVTVYPGTVTEWDNATDFPIAGSASFTFGVGTVTITLTNTLPGTEMFFDSQALDGISFQLFNGLTPVTDAGCSPAADSYCTISSSVAAQSGVTVLNPNGVGNITANTPVSPSAPSSTIDYILANIGTSGAFGSAGGVTSAPGSSLGNGIVGLGTNAFVLATSAPGSGWAGVNGILAAAPSGGYTNTNPSPAGSACQTSGQCNSGLPIAGAYGSMNPQVTQQFIYSTVTFTLSIPGVTPTTNATNVLFIYGPDGPDEDDWAPSTPEPSSLVLGGTGVLAIIGLRLWRKRTRFATMGPMGAFSADSMAASASIESEAAGEGSTVSTATSWAARMARWKRGGISRRGGGST
jgi:hypothetical protein